MVTKCVYSPQGHIYAYEFLQIGVVEAYNKPQVIANVTHALISRNMPARRVAGEILLFLMSADHRAGIPLILSGFDQVEQRLNNQVEQLSQKVGRFDIWIAQLDATIDGRGRLGSSVGASKEVRSLGDSEVIETIVISFDAA